MRLARQAGFADLRLVNDRPLEITDPELAARTGERRLYSATYRLFNIDSLEAGRVFPVCGNTFRMLHQSRLAPHFDFIGAE